MINKFGLKFFSYNNQMNNIQLQVKKNSTPKSKIIKQNIWKVVKNIKEEVEPLEHYELNNPHKSLYKPTWFQ